MKLDIEMLGFPRNSPAQKPPSERYDSFTEMPTHLITLPPELLEALKRLAPKTRARRWPSALGVATIVCIGIAMGTRILSNREAAVASLAPRASTSALPPKLVDAVESAPSAATPNLDAARPPGTPTVLRPAERPTTISVEALPHAATRKAPKNRHPQSPL